MNTGRPAASSTDLPADGNQGGDAGHVNTGWPAASSTDLTGDGNQGGDAGHVNTGGPAAASTDVTADEPIVLEVVDDDGNATGISVPCLQVSCAICMMPLQTCAAFWMPCCHCFHRVCLKNWFLAQKRTVCPVCKLECNQAVGG